LTLPQGGENRQLESKGNHRAAACPLLLNMAGPETPTLMFAKLGKHTSVNTCIHQNVWRNRRKFCMLST